MKRPNNSWPVTEEEYAKRPNRGRICFYCSQPIGEQHKADCVMRSRTVLVEARVRYVVRVPEDWTEDNILFHRNESSWCSNNGLDEIAAMHDALGDKCLDCHYGEDRMEYVFVREATTEDEEFYGVRVSEVEND